MFTLFSGKSFPGGREVPFILAALTKIAWAFSGFPVTISYRGDSGKNWNYVIKLSLNVLRMEVESRNTFCRFFGLLTKIYLHSRKQEKEQSEELMPQATISNQMVPKPGWQVPLLTYLLWPRIPENSSAFQAECL